MAYKLKIKNRFYICETKNGKRTYLESFSNEESADKYLKKLKDGGTPPSKMTVTELFEQYIENQNWSVTTLRNSRYVIQSYILPKLGKIRLSQLEPQECKNFIASLKTQKLKNNRIMGASYQRQCCMLLSGALTYAVEMNWIDKHPLENIDIPSVPKKNKEWTENDDWSRKAITELLNIENKTQMELFVSIALMCGLRIGEILAIEEDDIDFKNRKIAISKTISRANIIDIPNAPDEIYTVFEKKTKNAESCLVLKRTKTRDSERAIYFDQLLEKDLKNQLARNKKLNEEKKHSWQNNLIFKMSDGAPIEVEYMEKQFKKFQKERNLPSIVPHTMRGYCITIKLEASNGDIKSVQRDLGHADASMTLNTYARMDERSRKASNEKAFEMFRNMSDTEKIEDNTGVNNLNTAELYDLMSKITMELQSRK